MKRVCCSRIPKRSKKPMSEEIKCPECLKTTTQEELDLFGGFCEECREISDDDSQEGGAK